jgi:diguanylate cyclase (GGDEF)-like protein
MNTLNDPPKHPEFLLKSAFNVSLVSVIAIVPFTVYDFYVIKNGMGFLGIIAIIFCTMNAVMCSKGRYSLALNLFATMPIMASCSVAAINVWGVTASFWAYPAVLTCYFVLPLHLARLANIAYLAIILPFGWYNLSPEVFARFYAVLISISIFAYLTLKEIARQHSQLHALSITDVLTGLHNRFLLGDSLQNAINLHQSEKTAMSILMLDLDYFKKVNDQYGHDVGDDVLKEFATIMDMHLSSPDMLFRLGGEEFLILLHGADEHKAIQVAEEIRIHVQASQLLPDRALTVSIGICELANDEHWRDWLKQSDANLYLAKNRGRNKVIACSQR